VPLLTGLIFSALLLASLSNILRNFSRHGVIEEKEMTQGKKTLSNVVPVLVAALVCDVAVADPGTGKKNLIGIFDRINVGGKFPTKHSMSLYMKVTDAEGYYETEVRYVQVSSGKVLAQAKGELQSTDRLASADLYIQFPPLLIPEAGRYEFQVWANSIFLGATFIDAIPRPEPKGV